MNAQDTLRRMAQANPVPDAGHLHPDAADAERLFSSIERRRDEMIGTQTRLTPSPVPPPVRPWYRRPAMVSLIAIAAAMVVAVPLVLFIGGESEVTAPPATTAPRADVSTTLPPTTLPPTTVPATTVPSGTPPIPGNGYIWSEVTLNPGQFVPDETEIWSVTHGGSDFVAVGGVASDCAQVWVSADGSAWDGAPHAGGGVSAPCGAVLFDVASNGSRSVAVGEKDDAPVFWVSEDSHNWDMVSSLPSNETRFGERGESLPFEMASVAGSERGFVAVGSAIWFSPDGREWVEASAPPVDALVDVTSGPDGFFAVGYLPGSIAIFDQQWSSANAVLHSPNGQTWSVVAELVGSFQAESECWVAGNAITHGPGGYVIAGDCVSEDADIAYSSIWTSGDGLIWNQVPYDSTAFGEPAYITAITADDSGYLAAGWTLGEGESHANVWASDDGSSWISTRLRGEGSHAIRAIAVYEGTAVAVGRIEFRPAIWLGTRP